MVRPRKAQILNRQTRHSLLQYQVASDYHPIQPTDITYSVISAAAMNAATTSDVPDGAQEDLPARVESTIIEPYAVVGGNTFTILLDNIPIKTVTFTNDDITASRIANRINTAVGSQIAFNLEGKLIIKSLTTGSEGSIEITEVISGTLAALGISAGTYLGLDAGTRGIVTQSLDDKGGWVPLKTDDGKDIVTDCPSILYYYRRGDGTGHYMPEIPAGLPLHGRLIWDGSQYRLNYYAQVRGFAETITFNSNFSTLTSGDSFSIVLNYFANGIEYPLSTITVTFTGPCTRDEVIDLINAAYAVKASVGSPSVGPALVRGSISQPYSFFSEGLVFQVDDGVSQSVLLTPSDTTAQNVVDKINTSITGVTASVVTDARKELVQVKSNTEGINSSLILYNNVGSDAGTNTFEKLGIVPGKYRGGFIAEPYGEAEIRIRGLIRGSNGYITISGNSSTLQKLGLTAGTYYGSDNSEESVQFPQTSAKLEYWTCPVRALVPEVLEFGEVNPAVHSINEQFDSRVAGTTDVYETYNERWPHGDTLSRGTKNAGKVVVTNAIGVIDRSLLKEINTEFYNILGQITRGDFRPNDPEIEALIANKIETPGAGANTLPPSSTFTIDVDPDGYYASTNAEFRARFSRDHASVSIPFQVQRELPYQTEFTWNVNIGASGELAVLNNPYGQLLFKDANITQSGIDVGGSAIHYLPLTDSDNRWLHLIEQESNASADQSLLKSINARRVTVGDGVNTFGDFNGFTAIQDAVDYLVANTSFTSLTILAKPGVYGPVDMSSGPSTLVLTIQGEQTVNTPGGVIIVDSTEAIKVGIDGSTTTTQKIILKDLLIYSSVSTPTAISVNKGCSIECHSVYIGTAQVLFNNAASGFFDDCVIGTATTLTSLFAFAYNGNNGVMTRGFIIRNCILYSSYNASAIHVLSNDDSSPISVIDKIELQNCKIGLGGTTVSAGSLVNNSGLLSVDPNGADGTADEGVKIAQFNVLDCNVYFINYGGSLNAYLIIYHTPIGLASSGNLPVDGMTLRGGTWTLPDEDTEINPITIYGIGDNVGPNYLLPGLHFSDVTIQYDLTTTRTSAGAPVNQHEAWFGDDLTTQYLRWGVVALGSSQRLQVKDITVNNLMGKTKIGDFFFKWENEIDVDGIYLNYATTGTGNIPRQRIRLRSEHAGIAKFNKIIMNGNGFAYSSIAHITVEPYAASGGDNLHSVTISNCVLSNMVEGEAIQLAFSGAPDGIYTGSQIHFYNMSIIDNVFERFITSVTPRNGIQAITGDNDLFNLRITGNTIRNIPEIGIYINSNNIKDLNVQNNVIKECGTLGAKIEYQLSKGIQISNNTITECDSYGLHARDTKDDYTTGNIVITDNNIHSNNSNPWDAQIYLEMYRTGGPKIPRGILIGNNCADGAGSVGKIQINERDGGGAPTGLTSPTSSTHVIRGAYTAITAVGQPTTYAYNSGDNMILNYAELQSP